MLLCSNCYNQYCESCGSNNTCIEYCENFRHMVTRETYNKEFTLLSNNLCVKCFIGNLTNISNNCDNDCVIFATLSKSITYYNCKYHKP